MHSKFPGFGAAWSAWVADVEVNRKSGELAVTRVVVGQDTGTMVNPDGVRHQIHGNVIQATSRALKERVTFGENAVTSQEWGAYPILTFREVPVIDVVMMPRHGEPPMGAGESASLPGAAAIANALYDATGVRFRRPPFTPETIRAALADAQAEEAAARRKKRWRLGFLGAIAAGAAGWLGALSLDAASYCADYATARERVCARTGGARQTARVAGQLRGLPYRAQRRAECGRQTARYAIRHRLQHQHHARWADGHRHLVARSIRAGDAAKVLAATGIVCILCFPTRRSRTRPTTI